MARASFAELAHRLDNTVDAHLGDPLVLVVSGQRIALKGTYAIEEVVRQTDNGEAIVLQKRVSVQERYVPKHLVQKGATVERVDPYQAGDPLETHRVIDVERMHSGRTHLILGKV